MRARRVHALGVATEEALNTARRRQGAGRKRRPEPRRARLGEGGRRHMASSILQRDLQDRPDNATRFVRPGAPGASAMSFNSFGHVLRFTTWGESHGPAIGAVVDGCPPGLALSEADIQPWLDRRRPGTSRFTTQRREPDQVRILSGVFEGRTTGTPISLMIENVDQRSKDYSEVARRLSPRPCRLQPTTPNTAFATIAAAGAARRARPRRGSRRARWRGW